MIARKTGILTLDTPVWTIDRNLTEQALLASPLAQSETFIHRTPNPPNHENYTVHPVSIGGVAFSLTVYFFKNTVTMVHLVCSDPKLGNRPEDWSEANELARKAFHEELLSRWLERDGKTVGKDGVFYKAGWGKVSSHYDPRAGMSLIAITYRDPATGKS